MLNSCDRSVPEVKMSAKFPIDHLCLSVSLVVGVRS